MPPWKITNLAGNAFNKSTLFVTLSILFAVAGRQLCVADCFGDIDDELAAKSEEESKASDIE